MEQEGEGYSKGGKDARSRDLSGSQCSYTAFPFLYEFTSEPSVDVTVFACVGNSFCNMYLHWTPTLNVIFLSAFNFDVEGCSHVVQVQPRLTTVCIVWFFFRIIIFRKFLRPLYIYTPLQCRVGSSVWSFKLYLNCIFHDMPCKSFLFLTNLPVVSINRNQFAQQVAIYIRTAGLPIFKICLCLYWSQVGWTTKMMEDFSLKCVEKILNINYFIFVTCCICKVSPNNLPVLFVRWTVSGNAVRSNRQ